MISTIHCNQGGDYIITYKLHFIRTGKTTLGPRLHYVGTQDIPLCDTGAEALRRMANEYRYPKVEAVYTSPLLRCMQSAELIYPDTYTQVFDDFTDMCLGDFEGKSYEELEGTVEFDSWVSNSMENTPPGGEHTDDFARRIVGATDRLFATMMEQRMTNVAVITHGGVIMTLLAAIAMPRMPLQQWAVDNGCGYTMLMTPQMWMRDHCAEVYANIPEFSEYSGYEEDREDFFDQ